MKVAIQRRRVIKRKKRKVRKTDANYETLLSVKANLSVLTALPTCKGPMPDNEHQTAQPNGKSSKYLSKPPAKQVLHTGPKMAKAFGTLTFSYDHQLFKDLVSQSAQEQILQSHQHSGACFGYHLRIPHHPIS